MTADQLFTLYDRVAEAPDAIGRLRRFVLDLAVRGKLVAQDLADEPAANNLRSPKIPHNFDTAFTLPPSWAWVRVESVAETRLGKMLDKAKNKGSPRPYLRNLNVRWFDFDLSDLSEMLLEESELSEFKLKHGDVLICEGGEPGRAAVWDERASGIYFQKAIHRVRFASFVDPYFFVYALKASADDGRLSAYFTGTGIKHLTGKGLTAYRFPLPPLAEQRRIVAKVDELMALLDRLEAERNRREAVRDRLTAASLTRLTAADTDAEAFPTHARFALDAFPALTTRPDQIKQLRQTILSLAVRGKLVPQDPADEPASEFLGRISAQATNPAKAGGIRSKKQVASLDDVELPFLAPRGWRWTGLAQLFVVTGGIQKTPARTPQNNAFPYLGVGNVYRNRIDLSNLKQFELQDGELEKFGLQPFDIMVVEGNGSASEIGRCAMWEGQIEQCVHQNHLMRCRPMEPDVSRYALLYLNSPSGMNKMKELAITSAGLYSLSVGKISKIPIPLPPLAEQRRIVAKVDALMTLCDRMETALATADTTRARLLESLLHEALTPVAALEVAAAE